MAMALAVRKVLNFREMSLIAVFLVKRLLKDPAD
jgi:hypothetical protein